jgi:broad specificity phosphatase PhoE
MKLIFARHGETEANLADQFQGRIDTPLTEKGQQQATNLGKFLLHVSIDEVILSPLPRVKATYDIATAKRVIPTSIDERLIEICYGDWEGVSRAELDQEILKQRNDHRFTYIYPGTYNNIPGESYAIQYELRMKSFLEDLVSQNSEKTFLIISHQGPLLSVKKFFSKLTDEETGKVKTLNNEIYIVDVHSRSDHKLTSVTL